jgi:hypothetical protein
MTCFIANSSICRSYAKCNGWQETLAHFFVKCRRGSSTQSFRRLTSSSVSTDALSTYVKDQSVDSGHGSSSGIQMDNSNPQIPRVFETASSPDDPSQERLVRQIDLSPIIDENSHPSLSRTFSSPQCLSISNSILTPTSLLIENKDGTPEFLRRNSEEFIQHRTKTTTTPPQSSSASHEDLLSLIKTENSNDDITSMASSNDALSSCPPIITTSIKHLCDDGENNEQHRRLTPELRQILGRLIVLL